LVLVIFKEPYPGAGQAKGLKFSVPSILGNVFKELKEDNGCSVPSHGIINGTKHHILKAVHPSGLTVERGFFGCK